MYAVNFTEALENGTEIGDPLWPRQPCSYGWEFNHSVIPYTTIATEVSIHYKNINVRRTIAYIFDFQISSNGFVKTLLYQRYLNLYSFAELYVVDYCLGGLLIVSVVYNRWLVVI